MQENDQRIFIYMPGNYSYTLSYTRYNRRTYFRIRTRGVNSVDGTGLSCSGNIYNMSRLLCDGCFSLASSSIAYKETEENIEEYIIEDYTAKEDDEQ